MQSKRLYVLVRDDLSSVEYKGVQAGHAVAAYALKYPEKWKNEFLIYVRVKNEKDLCKWIQKMSHNDMDFVVFKEPDLNNEITAAAAVSCGRFFRKLQNL